MPIDALSVLCAQLTCDLLAIAKFLFNAVWALASDGFCVISYTLVLQEFIMYAHSVMILNQRC